MSREYRSTGGPSASSFTRCSRVSRLSTRRTLTRCIRKCVWSFPSPLLSSFFLHSCLTPPCPQILTDPLRFGDEISPDARSLLTGLLTRDPQQRLGVTGAESIRTHPFFAKHIDFGLLMQKKIQPPFKPSVESAADTSNFDAEFTSEAPQDSVVEDSHLSQTVQAQFEGFSCVFLSFSSSLPLPLRRKSLLTTLFFLATSNPPARSARACGKFQPPPHLLFSSHPVVMSFPARSPLPRL